jgi:protein phosphatase-4 regulatory subunit 3
MPPSCEVFYYGLVFVYSAAPAVRKWGAGRLLDAEEEEYFNDSDDEDTSKLSTPTVPVSPLGSVTLKRKRGKGFTTAALGRSPKQLRPLVDYEDEDDDDKLEETPKIANSSKSSVDQSVKVNWFAGLQDEESAAFAPNLPRPPIVASQTSLDEILLDDVPPRLGEKRRRDDDDEDEMLERLVRSKRATVEKEESKSSFKAAGGKLRLKLGNTTFSLGSSSQKKEADGQG